LPQGTGFHRDRSLNQGLLSVRLFGRFRAFWRGREVVVESRPARALLSLVVLRSRPWTRDAITAEIWPDAGFGPSPRLRQTLWLVRKGLARAGVDPAEVLQVDDDTIGLRSGIGVDSDVFQFEEFLLRRPPAFDAALELYGGEFAEDLGLECLATRREHLADLYEDALALVAQARLAAGDFDGARRAATELIERDQLREEAHSVLIEVYGRLGSRSQVHRQYRRIQDLLAVELDTAPLPETKVAYLVALARTTARSDELAAVTDNEFELSPSQYRSVGMS
jgi:two-component system, LytTR family, response regulator